MELARFFQVLDIARLEPQLLGPDERAVVSEVGAHLFDAVLPAQARMLYNSCRSAGRRFGCHLRIVLRIGPSELTVMPWEFMYDNESGMFPCFEYPIVRYVEQPLATESLQSQVPVRILGMIAAPTDQPDLSVADERVAVESAMHTLVKQELVKLDWVNGGTWKDLQRKFYKRQYQAFHFIGHGGFARHANEGYLIFTDDDGLSDPIPASEVAALFAGQHQLKLAVLNSCESARGDGRRGYTSVAEALVRRGIGAVFAMQNAISDPAATCFATAFYDALAALLPIDLATTYGRQAVTRAGPGTLEWGNAVLYLRSRDAASFLPA